MKLTLDFPFMFQDKGMQLFSLILQGVEIHEEGENLHWCAKDLNSTSLNMFKHYKLKPSFPIIKDNKTKDRAGVGDKPPPPSFVRSINPNFIQKLIRTEMDQI